MTTKRNSIVGRMSDFDKANVARLLKVRFPARGVGFRPSRERWTRPDDVAVYIEHNGQRVYGDKAARDYLKAMRAA